MNTLYRVLVLLVVAIGLLSGCASTDSMTNVEWQTHQQRLSSITHYSNSGKLGYISPEQRQSLNYSWQYSPDSTKLRLSTFLGQTVLNLHADAQSASVKTYDDEIYYASSPQALIHQLTGLTIPVSELNDWMLGKPTNADGYQLNTTNTLTALTKELNGQAWELNYLSYQDVQLDGVTLPLPRSMKLIQGNTSINIVVTKWTLMP